MRRFYEWIKRKILWLCVGSTLVVGAPVLTQGCDPIIDNPLPKAEIYESIKNQDKEVQAERKSEAITDAQICGEYTKGNFLIDIISVQQIEVEGRNGIEMYARAWRNGVPVGLGVGSTVETERFIIYDPRILVADPKGDIVIDAENIVTKEIVRTTVREDLKEATRIALERIINRTGRTDTDIVSGSIGKTTTTFYPSVDGLTFGGPDTFANARASAGDGVGLNPIENTYAGSFSTLGTSDFFIYRSKFLFDTAPLGDTDTINSAVFSVWPTGDFGAVAYGMVQGITASDVTIVAGDYDTPTASGFTEGAPRISAANWGTGAYEDFTLDATGLGFITKTGITKLEIRSEDDMDNTSPGAGDFYTNGYFTARTGTANDPMLVVVSTASGVIKVPNLPGMF